MILGTGKKQYDFYDIVEVLGEIDERIDTHLITSLDYTVDIALTNKIRLQVLSKVIDKIRKELDEHRTRF